MMGSGTSASNSSSTSPIQFCFWLKKLAGIALKPFAVPKTSPGLLLKLVETATPSLSCETFFAHRPFSTLIDEVHLDPPKGLQAHVSKAGDRFEGHLTWYLAPRSE